MQENWPRNGEDSFSAGGGGSWPQAARGEGEEGVARGCVWCEEEGRAGP
jgi:hypothetical protein